MGFSNGHSEHSYLCFLRKNKKGKNMEEHEKKAIEKVKTDLLVQAGRIKKAILEDDKDGAMKWIGFMEEKLGDLPESVSLN